MKSLESTDTLDTNELQSPYVHVYNSPEWSQLSVVQRSQLIMVAEWLKSWTILSGNTTFFLDIISKLWLSSLSVDDSNTVYMVWSEYNLWKYIWELAKNEWSESRDTLYRINWRFLGYPRCCVDEYSRPKKNLSKRKIFSPKKFITNFTYEAIVHGSIPEEFDFCPPSFTPCSIYCEEARKVLQWWWAAVKKNDPISASKLREYNIREHQAQIELFSDHSVSWKVKRTMWGK